MDRWGRVVRYYLNRHAEARGKKRKGLLWGLALQAAERSDCWGVFRWTHREGDQGARLVEFTRIGRSGAVYGRAHYKTRKPGAERWWGAGLERQVGRDN